MNRKTKLKSLSIVLCGILGLNSCRPAEVPIPTDDRPVIPNKESVIVPVAINVDKSYENDESIIAEGSYGYVDFPKSMMGGLEIKHFLKDYQNDEKLSNGIHYRVLAYKKTETGHILESNEDFVIGGDKKLNLDKTQKYTLIIYSFGEKNIVPKPSNISDLNKVSVDYTKAKLFLYDREDDYIPSEENEGLKLKLKHQFTGIKIVLDASDYFGGNVAGHMTNVSDVKLTYKGINKAIFNLGNGKPTIESSHREISINRMALNGTRESKESDWNYMILSPEDQELDFEAKVSMDKPMNGVNIGEIKTKLHVKRGVRQTIKISQQLCGALINNGAWKQFMCYDLGAYAGNKYPTQNPFQPAKSGSFEEFALHGSKYHWGYPYNGARMISAVNDYTKYSKVEFKRKANKIMPSNSALDKEHLWNDDDPCPDGYRVPTEKELNTLASFGFTGIGGIDNRDYNWQTGFILDSKKGQLFFPASGDRLWPREDEKDGIRWHGRRTTIWSSTAVNSNGFAVARTMTIFGDKGSVAKVEGYIADDTPSPYASIRCVKK